MRGDAVLALEHDDPPPGLAPRELARHREPDDAAPMTAMSVSLTSGRLPVGSAA